MDSESDVRRTSRPELGVASLLLAACLLALMWRFTYPSSIYLSFFTDDFFYYAVIARHLVDHGLSSFNGLQFTNGYHPLWMLTIAALYWMFVRSPAHVLPFFVAVVVLIWLLIVGSYRTLRALQHNLGLSSQWYSFPFAIWSMIFMAVLSRTGMEVSLALFFLLLFWKRMSLTGLESQDPVQAFLNGLLGSCAILSRIDCFIAISLYLLLTILFGARSRSALLRPLLAFAVGLSPVMIYIAINLRKFNTILSISGMAKNLRPFGTPSGAVAVRLFRVDSINLLFTWPSLIVAFLVLLLTARAMITRQSVMLQSGNRVLACVLIQPLVFYAVLTMTSDWPLWTWYLYVLVPILGLLGPTLCAYIRMRPSRLAQALSLGAVTCGGLLTLLGITHLNPEAMSVYESALAIQSFAASHPGRYAMGDRAGTPAWLIEQPIVQLEGLVEDRSFLNHIKNRDPLETVMTELGVDYYISAGAQPDGPCFSFREPYQAGPKSPTMKGSLCETPLDQFKVGQTFTTLIFKVGPGQRGDWR